jgi:hypothetical protein
MNFDNNNNFKDALRWCMLFEAGMTDDINEIISKGMWHEFTFKSKKDLLNAARAYRIFYKKNENINGKKSRKISKKSRILINTIKKCIQNNIVNSAIKFTIQYNILDFEKIIALALNPFYPQYHVYQQLLNIDIEKEEFVTITYEDIEPLKYITQMSKYTEYMKFWKKTGVR